MSLASCGCHLAVGLNTKLFLFNLKTQEKPVEVTFSVQIVAVAVSSEFVIVATNNKKVTLVSFTGKILTNEYQDSRKMNSNLEKNPTCLAVISPKEFVVADRFGGQLFLRLEEDGVLKKASGAGHLALITDMVYSNDGFLIAGDREEAIWVTRFPKTWVIENFCFGNRKYVSKLCLVDSSTLISGSGDGTLRVFNWKKGTLLSTLKVATRELGPNFAVTAICLLPNRQLLVATNEGPNSIHLLKLGDNGVLTKAELTQQFEVDEVTSIEYVPVLNAACILGCTGAVDFYPPLQNDTSDLISKTLSACECTKEEFNPLYKIFPRRAQTRERAAQKSKKRKLKAEGDTPQKKKAKAESTKIELEEEEVQAKREES